MLRSSGVSSALLHGGTSTVVALGAPPGEPGWRVAVETAPGSGPAPVAVLRDAALSVSAPHGRTLADGSGHVLDPRTGAPAEGPGVAAVIASSARWADAWSTALLVLGALPPGAPLAQGAQGALGARGLAALFGRGAPGARTWRAAGTPPPGSSFQLLHPVHDVPPRPA